MKEIDENELHAFVDGQLDDARMDEVMSHLEANPAAMARVRDFLEHKQAIVEGLHALAEVQADASTDALRNQLADRLLRSSPLSWLPTAAAIVLLIGSGWLAHGLYRIHAEAAVPDLVEDAAEVHQIFAEDREHAVEFPASQPDELVASASGHLGEPLDVPNLAPVGLDLIGGRLLGSEEGPLVQLLYEDRAGRRLTICVASHDTEAVSEVQIVRVDGLNAGYWQSGELAYAVVAKTPAEQLLSIAEEIGGMQATGKL